MWCCRWKQLWFKYQSKNNELVIHFSWSFILTRVLNGLVFFKLFLLNTKWCPGVPFFQPTLVLVSFSLLACLKWVWADFSIRHSVEIQRRPTLVLRRPYCFDVFLFPEVFVWPPPIFNNGDRVPRHLSGVLGFFRERFMRSQHIPSPEFYINIPWNECGTSRKMNSDNCNSPGRFVRAPPAFRPDWMWYAYSAMLFHLKINPQHLQWRWLIVRSGWGEGPHGVFFLYSGLCTVTADCKHWTEEISSSVEDLIVDWYFCCCQTFTLCWMGPSMMCTFYEGNIYLKCN